MTTQRTSVHGQWSSGWVFILAATGSAIGLGNIWRFPYITAENGGGAFVLVYLVCIAFVGIPIMMAEIMLGRRGRQSPVNTMRTLAQEAGRSSHWGLVGILGVLAGFLILTFYSVVAGWAMAYIPRAASGMFVRADVAQTEAVFAALLSDPERLLAWHTLFIFITALVIAGGVRSGLERAVSLLMPSMFVLLLILVGYALSAPGFGEAMVYMFKPDFSQIDSSVVLVALGHAFFTLSLGMGSIMAYGAYLPQSSSIPGTTLYIAAVDTCVALLAGVAIFPVMFTHGVQPAEGGPGLIFKILPIAFGQMSYGRELSVIFFVLLSLAAWTSALSLLEPVTAWLVELRGYSRARAAGYAAAVAWLLGLGSLLSLNVWSGNKLFGMTFFELMEYLAVNIFLPVGGLLIVLFAAWRLAPSDSRAELKVGRHVYLVWQASARFIAPAGVLVILLQGLFGS